MIARQIFLKSYNNFLANHLSVNGSMIRYNFASRDGTLDSKQKIELMRKQPWFQDYQTATKYSSQQKYVDALRHYYKVIQTMQEKNQKGQAYYYRIFERVLKINVLLERPLQTEENLYKLIKVKKALQKNPILVYEDYQNLMIHQLNYNVEKAIKLGKALLSQSQLSNLPINNEKHIRMLLGNAYLLVDNFPDAKKKYGEVLEMKPSHSLRGKTLNNLAIACWWHKNPMFPVQQQFGTYEELRINRDFKQTKQLLMNSIGALENIDEMSQKQAVSLQSLLNENPDSMLSLSSKGNKEDLTYSIQYKESLQPIYNVIQHYIYNDPIQKPLILAWMRIILKAASKFQKPQLIDQITSKYYLLNNDVSQLKKLLKTAAPRYESQQTSKDKPSQSKNSLTQKLYLLQLYKMMSLINRVVPSNPPQFNIDDNKIKSLEKQITQKDPFIFKRQFILGEQLSFMKSQNNKN